MGLAICDSDEMMAIPLEIVPASAAFPAIRAIAARESVQGIVIGLPLLPSGDEGEMTVRARRLGDRLARALDLPVEYEDERLSTVAAEQMAMRRGPIDDLAAMIVLQQFIDRRRYEARQHVGRGSEGDARHADE